MEFTTTTAAKNSCPNGAADDDEAGTGRRAADDDDAAARRRAADDDDAAARRRAADDDDAAGRRRRDGCTASVRRRWTAWRVRLFQGDIKRMQIT